MDTNVWKTTHVAVNRSAPDSMHLQFSLSSNLKYFRIVVTPVTRFLKILEYCKCHCKEKEVSDFCHTVF